MSIAEPCHDEHRCPNKTGDRSSTPFTELRRNGVPGTFYVDCSSFIDCIVGISVVNTGNANDTVLAAGLVAAMRHEILRKSW